MLALRQLETTAIIFSAVYASQVLAYEELSSLVIN